MTGLKAKRLTGHLIFIFDRILIYIKHLTFILFTAYLQLQTTRATYMYLAPEIMETEMLKTMLVIFVCFKILFPY